TIIKSAIELAKDEMNTINKGKTDSFVSSYISDKALKTRQVSAQNRIVILIFIDLSIEDHLNSSTIRRLQKLAKEILRPPLCLIRDGHVSNMLSTPMHRRRALKLLTPRQQLLR